MSLRAGHHVLSIPYPEFTRCLRFCNLSWSQRILSPQNATFATALTGQRPRLVRLRHIKSSEWREACSNQLSPEKCAGVAVAVAAPCSQAYGSHSHEIPDTCTAHRRKRGSAQAYSRPLSSPLCGGSPRRSRAGMASATANGRSFVSIPFSPSVCFLGRSLLRSTFEPRAHPQLGALQVATAERSVQPGGLEWGVELGLGLGPLGGRQAALRTGVRAYALASKGKRAQEKMVYMCDSCGGEHGQWFGSCKYCKEGTLKKVPKSLLDTGASGSSGGGGGGAAARVSERMESMRGGSGSPGDTWQQQGRRRTGGWVHTEDAVPQRLPDIQKNSPRLPRLQLEGEGGKEVCRVLGGGIVPGSLVLVGGDPGVGKSTLLLQIAALLAEGAGDTGPASVLYVSAEESVEQVKMRADRMNIEAQDLFIFAENEMEKVLGAMQQMKLRAVVVDSIQTVYLKEATGSTGSVSQVKECAELLLRTAKKSNVAIFLVGHVTKSGEIAGPRVLEHIVDVVLYMEGESLQSYRLLRSIKNRFGATDEVGVFEMTTDGLGAVANPSALFLGERNLTGDSTASACVAVTMQGTRPLLLEIQALCSKASEGGGSMSANGVDMQRIRLMVAVLSKHAKLKLHDQNVFLNVVGGMQAKEVATDLAVVVAIASSLTERAVPREMAFIGEVGLHGELRPVGQLERRVSEAAKLGFTTCIVPASGGSKLMKSNDMHVVPCRDVVEVLIHVLKI